MSADLHHTQCGSFSEAVIRFGQIAREHGLNVGIQECLEALQAAREGLVADTNAFRYGLRAIYCCSEEDMEVFDRLFDRFWGREKMQIKSRTTYRNQSNIMKKSQGSVVMLGQGKQEAEEEDSKNVSGANAVERLRKTDFSKIKAIESDLLEEIAYKLWKQMSLRLKRRAKVSRAGGRIDLRRTIRKNISAGGDPIHLRFRDRKPRKQRLILLLDVSGSMDKYSFFLLRFLYALRVHFERVEAFIFSTRLIRITDYLEASNLDATLSVLSAKADNWSSGTKIGVCMQEFNEQFAKRILNGQSTVIVLSDGLDTGSPELLAEQMKKIRLRTRQLIWLNPLKGMAGYEPIQKGMSSALPEVDVFRSAHNLDSILELENFLIHV